MHKICILRTIVYTHIRKSEALRNFTPCIVYYVNSVEYPFNSKYVLHLRQQEFLTANVSTISSLKFSMSYLNFDL